MPACSACGKENPEGFQFCGFCTAPLTGESREERKTVTVVFSDVTGSTALGESADPEALRALLARYFERMKAIVESHGGTVEKFIGDAVMAVFGVPVAHEDDALRACRAAAEMRDAVPELGVQARIGVNTGEVVTGTSERLATGDAVNVAARLEQAASPGEVLFGEATHALVRDAVAAEPVEALALKGKSKPVRAYRLVSVVDAPERSHDSRFVGRKQELEVISAAWMRAGAEQRCELVTVVGEAGVGKSRLVVEALAGLDTKVVRGRCLPYGEGITYWPVVEVVKQLGELPSDPVAAEAIRALLGESERGASADEIAWAFRKLLEDQAPLVVVFDDLQWGEETFLDLVEATSLLSADAPLLFLCMARPELVERRPSWSAPLRLQPLGAEDAVALIGDAVSGEQRERIAHAAGGNPLFITEMLAMAGDDADVDVPPTLKALLAMRLDQLDPEERRVLECGSIEGEIFHRGGVQALAAGETQVTTRLAALVRRQLIQTDHSQLAGEDGYRFRHLLIRDAAYEALPKATRAELHERFAAWLEGHGQDLVEFDEIVGYHLEQAHRSRAELGQIDEEVAQRAARALAKAGLRSYARGDMSATNLLERAAALVPAEDVLRRQILPELGIALTETGELTRAAAVLDEAIAAGRSQGDARVEHSARAQRALLQALVDPKHSLKARQDVQEAIEVLDALEDHGGLARAWYAAATFAHWSSHASEAEAACEHAFEHANQAGDRRLAADALWRLCTALVLGPTPAAEAERRIAELVDRARGDRKVEAVSHTTRAPLVAMQGRFDEARAHRDRAVALNEELGLRLYVATVSHYTGYVEVLAGDLAAAEAEHRASADLLRGMGAKSYLSATLGYLAEIVCAEGRDDEALELTTETEALHPETNFGSLRVRAQVFARRGEQAEAESLAREACALADSTDHPDERAAARSALAEVLRLAGRPHEAAAEAELALRHYEAKGNLVMAKRARGRLAELQAQAHASP